MRNFSLLVVLGIGCCMLAGCDPSDEVLLESSLPPEELVAGRYAVESCNSYLDFVECHSVFSSLDEAGRQQISDIIDAMKTDWDSLPQDALQDRCDEMWSMVISTPELVDHPQCGIQI